jgi:hypothetical protein
MSPKSYSDGYLNSTSSVRTEFLVGTGSNGQPVFAPEAMNALHFYSQGITRVINLLCENSLINTYVGNLQPVPGRGSSLVGSPVLQFRLSSQSRRPFQTASLAVLHVILGLRAHFGSHRKRDRTSSSLSID